MIPMRKVSDAISKNIEAITKRSRAMQGFLNTVIYKEYQNAQRSRWMSENGTEGARWERLNPKYAQEKRKRFASYPGGGTKMLIATNRLFTSVVGPGDGHRKVTTSRSISIFTTVPYAEYVDEKRNFTKFGPEFQERITDKLNKYLLKGKR